MSRKPKLTTEEANVRALTRSTCPQCGAAPTHTSLWFLNGPRYFGCPKRHVWREPK